MPSFFYFHDTGLLEGVLNLITHKLSDVDLELAAMKCTVGSFCIVGGFVCLQNESSFLRELLKSSKFYLGRLLRSLYLKIKTLPV